MNARDFPECPSYRGFGWELGPKADRFRVLGNDGARARVQYLMRGEPRPRAWVPLSDPWLRGLAKWIATGPPWVNPAQVAPVVTVAPAQVCLFGMGSKT